MSDTLTVAPLRQDPCIYWPSLKNVSVMKKKLFYNIENPFQWHFHMVHKICRLLFLEKLQNKNKLNIVSRFPNETMSFGPQMFIVKSLIIGNTEGCHIYIWTERRGKGLVAGETKRECVRDGEWLKMEATLVVKTAIEETDHFGII